MLRIIRYIKRSVTAIYEKLFKIHSPSKEWVCVKMQYHKDETGGIQIVGFHDNNYKNK